jgi:nucleotide-binding universal stress UspA family protein
MLKENAMKILLATDNSGCAKTAVEQVCGIITNPNATTVEILSVAGSMIPVSTEFFDVPTEHIQELQQRAEKSVADAGEVLREKFKGSNLTVESKALFGSPKKTIVKEAENFGADLIVVGTHDYGTVGRFYMDSVSDAVMRHAPCSVLVARKKKI